MSGDAFDRAYPVLGAALFLLTLFGLGFRLVYAYIKADAKASREEQDKVLEKALAAQETRLSGNFNARILTLETHIKVLEARIAEEERIRKLVVSECAKGLRAKTMEECCTSFQSILATAG